MLRNAIAEPVRQLIATEVDSPARARAAIERLIVLNASRPSHILDLDADTMTAEAVLERATQWVEHCGDNLGLLFVLDDPFRKENSTVNEDNDHHARDFWRRMNQLRESWDALAAQVVFFLLPANYRHLSLHADHLKRWIPLKLHLLGDESGSATRDRSQSMAAAMSGLMSPDVARVQLRRLETDLAEAIRTGAPQAERARRYYLPMFAAAVSLHNLGRAKTLRDQIDDQALAEPDRPSWLSLNTLLNLFLFDLDTAQHFAEAQCTLAKQQGDEHGAAITYHQLGRVAEERRDFVQAEAWYQKSLAIFEQQGNEHGAAITYHQLGRVAEERRDFVQAEAWYQKSLAIFEQQGDEHGAAITYHQLGRVAEERRDFVQAEAWYQKSLAIEEQQGNEHGAAITYHQLGRVAQEQREFDKAGTFFLKAIGLLAKVDDSHILDIAVRNYAYNLHAADELTQAALRQRWRAAGWDSLVSADEL